MIVCVFLLDDIVVLVIYFLHNIFSTHILENKVFLAAVYFLCKQLDIPWFPFCLCIYRVYEPNS